MAAPNPDFHDDELIQVKLPRSEYERLRQILERERTYNWLEKQLKSTWIWVFAGGMIAFITLYEKIYGLVVK